MKAVFQEFVAILQEFIAILNEARAEYRWPLASKARNLDRRVREQSTEDYWLNRERAASGRLRVIAQRYRIVSLLTSSGGTSE